MDEVLAVFMPAGNSYTGEDQAEIFCHGGSAMVRAILAEIIGLGARAAEPGEFTKLAFLAGRIDLAKAEAVAETIAAATEVSLAAGREHLLGVYSEHVDRIRETVLSTLAEIEALIDFTEEDIDPELWPHMADNLEKLHADISGLAGTYRGGRIIREGFRIAIAGRTNAGKSSLFNLLLEQERALVDPEAGTTRDYLSEWIDLQGFAVKITDTAGFREQPEPVEERGQAFARDMMAGADLILWLADSTQPGWLETARADVADLVDGDIVFVGNKIDLLSNVPASDQEGAVRLSCKSREGLDRLRGAIAEYINEGMPDLTSGQVVTSARHHQCLELAADAVAEAVQNVRNSASPEIVAFELRRAADSMGEITGKVYTEEILGEIFAKFCIGK